MLLIKIGSNKNIDKDGNKCVGWGGYMKRASGMHFYMLCNDEKI